MKRALTVTPICTVVIATQVAGAQSPASLVYSQPVAFTASRFDANASRSHPVGATDAPLGDARHGVIGAVSGAIVGGGLGFLYMVSHCDNDVCSFPTRAVLTGAAAGAVVGMIVEYGIRSWPEQKARLAAEAMVTKACVPSTREDAKDYRDGYGSMVSRTDSMSVAQRKAFHLQTLEKSAVTIVTDSATCVIASAAYDKTLGVSAANEAPIVLKLGTQWAVIKKLDYPGVSPNLVFNHDFSIVEARIWF